MTEDGAQQCLENRRMPLSFELKRMNNLISRYVHSGLVNGGFDEITIMHGWILGFLYDCRDRNIYQRDLETRFGIAKSTVTNIIKLMLPAPRTLRTRGLNSSGLLSSERRRILRPYALSKS